MSFSSVQRVLTNGIVHGSQVIAYKTLEQENMNFSLKNHFFRNFGPLECTDDHLCTQEGQSFEKSDFLEKNSCFPAPMFYMQLLDCRALYHWQELFKRKRMTYCLSIYLLIS